MHELLAGHAAEVAPRLLGARLSVTGPDGTVTIRLTEVEAYGGEGEDPGSHAFPGIRPRNSTMFGPSGHLYVYFTYGMHHCANIVTGPDGVAGAVLLRAGEVVAGEPLAARRRFGGSPARASSARDLARGPGRMTVALGLDRSWDGLLIRPQPDRRDRPADSRVVELEPLADPPPAQRGPRVGVSTGADILWRFWIPADPTVSAYRPGRAKRRQIRHG